MKAAKKYGWFAEATAHMENKRLIPLKWTEEKSYCRCKKIRNQIRMEKGITGALTQQPGD